MTRKEICNVVICLFHALVRVILAEEYVTGGGVQTLEAAGRFAAAHDILPDDDLGAEPAFVLTARKNIPVALRTVEQRQPDRLLLVRGKRVPHGGGTLFQLAAVVERRPGFNTERAVPVHEQTVFFLALAADMTTFKRRFAVVMNLVAIAVFCHSRGDGADLFRLGGIHGSGRNHRQCRNRRQHKRGCSLEKIRNFHLLPPVLLKNLRRYCHLSYPPFKVENAAIVG